MTVRLTNTGNDDTLSLWDSTNTPQLALGSVATGASYVSATATFPSATMVRSGNTITITLGTMAGGTVITTTSNRASIWAPSASASDQAYDAMLTTPGTESGTSDPNF